MRIARHRIEFDLCIGLGRVNYRLLKADFVCVLALSPVVTITAQGDDGLGRIQLCHSLRQQILIPTLRRN